MKIPQRVCQNFKKMTEEEWLQLQAHEKLSQLNEESERKSSIQFDNSHGVSHHDSKRSSILKWPSMEVPNETCANESILLNDALDPIRKKCLEAVSEMKAESILRMLCDDAKDP